MNTVNAFIRGPISDDNYLYKTVIIKRYLDLLSQLIYPNTKYVIKHNFNLDGQTIEIPSNCIIAIDGGSLSNGILIGNNSILLDVNKLGNTLDNIIQSGTWKDTIQLDSISIGEVVSGDIPSVTNVGDNHNAILNFVLPRGEKGEKGPQGLLGRTGALGLKGDQGPKGEKGDTGELGIQGILGEIGKSAYQSYLDTTEDNPPLSESDWILSLKGPQGDQGILGEQGIQGIQGEIGPQGPKGDTGNTGAQGAQGPKGDTVTATDYTLYNVQGADFNGAMSQDATTKAISAQTGYYTCETAAGTAAKVVTVESGNLYKRTLGGHFKVKMTNANTAASGVTLQVGSETATALWYNGAAVSASNSWEKDEVISVYFDGSKYHASNAQGGSNKKIDAYLYGDLRTLAVGQNYEIDESVKTTDKQFRKITKEIKTLSLSEELAIGDIRTNGNATYRADDTINTYDPEGDYSEHPYALGSFAEYTYTVAAESITAGNITVNGTEVAIETTDDAASIATKIATALVIDGWTTSASENIVTVRCNTIGNNTTTITITDTDSTGVVVESSSVAGTNVIRKYDGETWTNATVSGMETDGKLVSVDEAWLITNATQQNSVTQDIKKDLTIVVSDTLVEQYKDNVNRKTSGSNLSNIWGNRHNVASVVDGIYWKCHGGANSLSVYQAKSGSATLIKTFQKDSTWIDGHWIKLYFDSPVTIQSGCYIGVYGYAYFGTTSGVGLQFYCNQNGSGWGSDNNITIGVYSFYEKSKIDEIEESIEDKQAQIDSINEDIDFIVDKTYYEDRLPTVGRTNNKYVHVSNGQAVYDSLANFYYTGFIYVGDCSSIKIPACHSWGCVFFDANKQYNGHHKYTSADINTPVTVDVPENTSYVQVNIKTSDAQYVYCYLSEVRRELSPTLKTKTSQIVDRNGQDLILPLDRIITEPSGGQTSLSENRFTQTGATTGGYLTAAQSGGVWTTTWHSSGLHRCTDYIDIHDAIKLTIGCDVTANFVYFDENKVCCGNFVGNGSLTAKTTIPPAGAYYVRMNYDTRYISSSSLIVYFNVNTYNLNPIVAISQDSITALKPLSGLKVAWYGTSIPHGYPYQNSDQATYSYANRAVTELGGIIQNRCVSGGFIISATNTADTHNQTSRFTDIDPEGTYYSAVNYKTRIVDLIGTADEPDIFVFDWGANDGQFYQSYFNGINLDTVDITTEDIKTFIGAYNTIIKALLTAKPKARIFLVTHYSDDGQSNEMTRKDGYRTMNRLIEKIADYWHIPCNSVYKKTGWIYNRNGISNIKSQWCKDGIHPANSGNVESIKFLTKIHKQFLMENYCY